MAKQSIFISYRRQDTVAYAGRIYDRLAAKYGEHNVFMDIDRIEPGQDFVDAINHSVAEAGVLLVLIGREWIKMTDKSGVPRLDNPEDFVRLEILAGLEQKTVIIPVLLADAEMPSAQVLPPPLQPFARGRAGSDQNQRRHRFGRNVHLGSDGPDARYEGDQPVVVGCSILVLEIRLRPGGMA